MKFRTRNLIFIAPIYIFATTLFAQPSIEWQMSFGGSNYEEAFSIQQTNEGGYFVAGYSLSNNGNVSGNHGIHDYWVIRLDSSHNIQWQRSLGGDDTDWLHSSQLTNDGGYILAGLTQSSNGDIVSNHGDKDMWIVKLSNNGDVQWQKALGGSGREEAWAIQQTTDGGYIVAGRSDSSDGDVSGNHGNSTDYWIVKLNSVGSILWQKSFGGNNEDIAYSIKETLDGGYIVVGETGSNDGDVTNNHGVSDYWVLKLNSFGTIEWQQSLGSNSFDQANDVYCTNDKGFIVVGQVSANNGDVTNYHGGVYDAWVVKLDSIGTIEWQKTLGGSSDSDFITSVQQTNDDGYIVAGQTESVDGDVIDNDGGADIWVLKLTPQGEIQWQKTFGGTKAEWSNCIQQTSDGGFAIAGMSWSNDGDVTNNYGSADFWIVKLSSESVPIGENVTEADRLTIYPNPSSGKLFITPKEDILYVSIADLTGRVILYPMLSADRSITTYNLPNGIYSVSITTRGGKVLKANFVKQE